MAADDLEAVRVRLERILDPYRGGLVAGTIYNLPTLRREGSKAHDWFAFVKPSGRSIGLFLMPVVTEPSLLDGISPELRRHHTGKSTFTFSVVDDGLFAELEGLVARAYDRYVAAG
jgi:hypothetical protein